MFDEMMKSKKAMMKKGGPPKQVMEHMMKKGGPPKQVMEHMKEVMKKMAAPKSKAKPRAAAAKKK